jgi:serine/threonine-protein kinase
LDQRIAAGGVGQVWRATDLLLERPVAVKVLRPEYADHPETLDRFRKEARHAGALSHPHVAQVYDYGPAGPEWPPYLVMEFVDGPSLADILAVEPIEAAFALDVIAQAADGLSAAHRAGLVHRDVKPGNILIGPEGLVKVTDFGIAHAAGQAPITGPNTVMGTTQYMAPERISGDQGSPASDLYALGIVLHECLTGEPPYAGAPADVMAAHLYSVLPPLPDGLPPELDVLVSRLTVKNPAERSSDARELAVAAAELRDTLAAGPLVSFARSGASSGPGIALAQQAAPVAGHGPAGPAGGAGTPPAGGAGADRAAAGLMGTARLAEISDEWAVPPRMSLPASPVGLIQDSPRRRRRGGTLAVGAAVVAGVALIGALLAGALRQTPAANPAPAARPTASAAVTGSRPAGAPRTSGPAVSSSAPAAAVPGTTSPQSAKHGKKPSPTSSAAAAAGASSTGTGSATASPSAAASTVPAAGQASAITPNDAPSQTSPATSAPTQSSAAPSTTAPSPESTPAATTPAATPSPAASVCLLVICL